MFTDPMTLPPATVAPMTIRHSSSRHALRRHSLIVCLVVSLVLLVSGCAPESVEEQAADRELVLATLKSYLALLSEGYATGNLEPMRQLAAEKEVATVAKLVSDYARQGMRIDAQLKEITLEDLTVWSSNNAYATTVEVWDLRKRVVGTDRLLSEALGRTHRVKYQLKRRAEGWQVLYREARALE